MAFCFNCGRSTASPTKSTSSLGRRTAAVAVPIDNDDDGIEFERRPPNLHSIYKDDHTYNSHRAMLEEWRTQLESSERRLARKQASENSSRADLYQILGLFFVFQGVVVTAVAQSNQLQCHNWGLPFVLSLLVSLAALGASIQKLREVVEFSEQVRLEKSLYKAIHKSLEALEDEGTDFDIQKGLPQLGGNYTAGDSTGVGSVDNIFTSVLHFGGLWVWSYSGAVIALLLSFSGVTLFSVYQILCNSGGN